MKQIVKLAFHHETGSRLGDLSFENTLESGMPEQFYRHIHGFRLLEYVFGGNVAYKVLAEILVGGGVCGIISSDSDLEPVVEKGFRHR